MLHIYYGNGKGKTTAAVGLAVRAAGAGMNVLFMQFLKNGESSEISILQDIENIQVSVCKSCDGFVFNMTDIQKKNVCREHDEMLVIAYDMMKSGTADMIVLDELADAYEMEMLCREKAEEIISEFSDKAEIVVTGHTLQGFFSQKAHYITEMRAEKHPFNDGISARKGIEY